MRFNAAMTSNAPLRQYDPRYEETVKTVIQISTRFDLDFRRVGFCREFETNLAKSVRFGRTQLLVEWVT